MPLRIHKSKLNYTKEFKYIFSEFPLVEAVVVRTLVATAIVVRSCDLLEFMKITVIIFVWK